MRRGIGFAVSLTATFALLPESAFAGAWTQPAGHGQVVVTATSSTASGAFDGSRDRQSIPRYNKFELQGLVEYGFTDRFTLMAAPGLQHIDIAGADGGNRTGLGYSEFGGRYAFAQSDSWVFSGQTLLRIPGTGDTANPAAIGYTDAEIDLRGLFGYSFTLGGKPAFVDLQLAQRFRLGDPPNELRADIALGWRAAPQWLLLAQSLNVFSEGAGGALFPSYDYHKLQLSAVYDLTAAWSLQAGGFTTFSGRNALQENGLLLGAWYKF